MLLHAGCGPRGTRGPEEFDAGGWRELRLDIDPAVAPDVVASLTDMAAVVAESVDAVYSAHTLEHLYAHEVPRALAEFRRVLRPGGRLVLAVPDLQAACAAVAAGDLDGALYLSAAGPIAAADVLYGHRVLVARGNTFMAHRTGFTARSLALLLLAAGFRAPSVTRVARPPDLRARATR